MKDLGPFEDLEQVEAWLEAQENERVRPAFAARAALRALPAAMAVVDQNSERLAGDRFLLVCLRATLTSGATGTHPTPDLKNVEKAAYSAAESTLSAAESTVDSALSAAALSAILSATLSAALSARTAARSAGTVADTAANAAANAAVLSDRSIARSATKAAVLLDGTHLRDEGIKTHFAAPLWEDKGPVSDLLAGWETFQKRPDPEGVWAFWIQWYRGMLEGSPMDWDLQLQVALIDDAIWEEGPKAVAAAIRDIQTDQAGPSPLEKKVLRKHVEYLLRNPVLSEATALNGAATIERAIAEYLREAPANCLPEDLKHLEVLPQHFKAIAHVIGSQAAKDEKEKRLIDEISKLHARVAELEKELAVAKSKELKGVVSQNVVASLGKTIGSLPFLGVLATGTCYFFGVTPSDLSLENLRDYLAELSRANSEATTPSTPILPPSTDV